MCVCVSVCLQYRVERGVFVRVQPCINSSANVEGDARDVMDQG